MLAGLELALVADFVEEEEEESEGAALSALGEPGADESDVALAGAGAVEPLASEVDLLSRESFR